MEMATRKRRIFLEQTLHYDDYKIPVNDGSLQAQQRAESMVRHEFTNYEDLLQNMPRSRNLDTNAMIYQTLKNRVMLTIASHLPELAHACETQDMQPVPQQTDQASTHQQDHTSQNTLNTEENTP